MNTPSAFGAGLLAGLLIGVGAMFGFYKPKPPSTAPEGVVGSPSRSMGSGAGAGRSGSTISALPKGATPKEDPAAGGEDEEKDNDFAAAMREFGQARSELAYKTLVEDFGLEGAQLEAFTRVFEDARGKRDEAFAKVFSGQATLEDYAMMEGYSPELDAWVAGNLDADQQEQYAAYKQKEELNRVERKANEELGMLSMAASLNAEQKDAAFDIFAEHQARETPDRMLEIDSMDTFRTQWSEAIGSRREALAGVLDDPQIEAYDRQSAAISTMVERAIQSALEAEQEP